MIAPLVAGLFAGFVLGFLGAGGTVIGLPILLLLSSTLRGHRAFGTNALGVAFIAAALFGWRLRTRRVRVREGLAFAVPGLLGIAVGVRLGLGFPGHRLVSLLGFVLFAVAAWMLYLSTRVPQGPGVGSADSPSAHSLTVHRAVALGVTAVAVGATAGFFAIGGGFMIVPALMIAGGLELAEAASTALLPIAVFAALVGIEYVAAGTAVVPASGIMLASGLSGGAAGIWLADRLPRPMLQRAFAAALVAIGVYLLLR
jgi:uncharacterized membrane protein YfcA